MIRNLILLIFLILSVAAKGHDCLPHSKQHLLNSPKYLVKTVKGKTYREAKVKLQTELPNIGLLQTVKQEEVQKLTNKDYYKSLKRHSQLKANIDLWYHYNCQHEGDYYITAVLPKSNISYVDYWYPSEITLVKLNKFCAPHKKIVLLGTNVIHKVKAEKSKKIKIQNVPSDCSHCHWYVFCGQVKLKIANKEYNNDFDNFIAVLGYWKDFGGGNGMPTSEDHTLDFWLELTKDI